MTLEDKSASSATEMAAVRAVPYSLTASPDLSDVDLLSLGRQLRETTLAAISSNGSARLSISDDFLNIDYLIDKDKLLLALPSEFPCFAPLSHPGNLAIDQNGKKYILIGPYASLQDRQFFLAAQLAHFRLHVASAIREKLEHDVVIYFPKDRIDPVCFRQASIFAYGLLVPEHLQSSLIVTWNDQSATAARDKLLKDVVDRTLMPQKILERHINLINNRLQHDAVAMN